MEDGRDEECGILEKGRCLKRVQRPDSKREVLIDSEVESKGV